MKEQFCITTFYKFSPILSGVIGDLGQRLVECANIYGIRGLILIGPEGCNATIAAVPKAIEEYKNFLQSQVEIGSLFFKDTFSDVLPFRRFKVEMRSEIVNIKNPAVLPDKEVNNHLTPSEWNKIVESERNVMVVDTRNFYETEIGAFEGAVDLKISKFSDFPKKFESLSVPKNTKLLMYCTGGIRCEKAIVELQTRGYSQCFQLEGGILNYLKEYPNSHFKGQCFVFDHRVAVDQMLEPSQRYTFCPHCGNPAEELIECGNCGAAAKVCSPCQQLPGRRSCSKNCAHHLRRVIQPQSTQNSQRG